VITRIIHIDFKHCYRRSNLIVVNSLNFVENHFWKVEPFNLCGQPHVFLYRSIYIWMASCLLEGLARPKLDFRIWIQSWILAYVHFNWVRPIIFFKPHVGLVQSLCHLHSYVTISTQVSTTHVVTSISVKIGNSRTTSDIALLCQDDEDSARLVELQHPATHLVRKIYFSRKTLLR
jgi:hypothetical protein